MELRPMGREALEPWRKKYRKKLGLPVIPDFHEALCQMGRSYLVEDAGKGIGYVILTEEAIIPGHAPFMPEFYLEVEPAKAARQLIIQMLERLAPQTIISRTDDLSGFPLLMDLRLRNQIASSLYVLKKPVRWAAEEGLTIVATAIEDAPALQPIYASVAVEDGGIPDEMSLTKSIALWKHFQLIAAGEVAGVCYVVPQNDNFFTISPIILTAYRNRGFGRHLSAFVANQELSAGRTLIATATPENEAGRGLFESINASLASHIMYFQP